MRRKDSSFRWCFWRTWGGRFNDMDFNGPIVLDREGTLGIEARDPRADAMQRYAGETAGSEEGPTAEPGGGAPRTVRGDDAGKGQARAGWDGQERAGWLAGRTAGSCGAGGRDRCRGMWCGMPTAPWTGLCRRWQKTEDRRQKTGDRRQETGDRRQETGDRRQKTEGRRQKTEDGRRETGDRRQTTATTVWLGRRVLALLWRSILVVILTAGGSLNGRDGSVVRRSWRRYAGTVMT